MDLSSPVTDLNGVGEAQASKLSTLGIKSIADLIDYFPRRYEDYSVISKTSNLSPGMVSIRGVIKQATGRYVRRGLHITEAIASDAFGSIRLIWFNQPYRAKSLKLNTAYYISGNYELARNRFAIMNPSIEIVSDFSVNTARILAVYRETKGIDSRQIRQALVQVLPLIKSLDETLPDWLIKKANLISRSEAINLLHFPNSSDDIDKAKRRLGFEEVFSLSLASQLNKQEIKREKAVKISFKESLAKDFVNNLAFKLTDGQRVTAWRIYKDLQKTEPMNRLIEGDVGSGKTVVAVMAALMAIADNKQVALMAPTELLARQHADSIYKLLKPIGMQSQVVLLVGSMKSDAKIKAHKAISSGKAGFIIGTQALIQEKVDMHKLALIIIDEQHRFGVEQRKALIAKAGHMPHVLSLTATPIPRSLALTLYGELDVSLLKEKPAGRQPIKTELIWPPDLEKLYKSLNQIIDKGQQIFVVCPSISESQLMDIKSVETVYEQLTKGPFKNRRVGLLHGKLKASDKQAVMEQFVNKQLDVLVATTVIEVGVDVPNASVMLIQNPERFGLAQLHQLRGRVGRSNTQGYCYLIMESTNAPHKRLSALVSSNDGFKLAELDLNIRGPGAIYGTMQHGKIIQELKITKLSDTFLISEATEASKQFILRKENLLKYKELNKRVKLLRIVSNLN